MELFELKMAIMQPYFMPYIGYFQLINAVDEFVIYDNIKYTKKGWINRNRILVDGKDFYVTIPLRRDSDYLDVRDRHLAETWPVDRVKLLNRITTVYAKAPYFQSAYAVIEKSILHENDNLFHFILNSLLLINEYLEIRTPVLVSSAIPIDHELRSESKVMEICRARKADAYFNPIGGVNLYSWENFKDAGIDLFFLKTGDVQYGQFGGSFVPSLSIMDVMMFNSIQEIRGYLRAFFTIAGKDRS
jgi:hypothetical protein